MLKKEVHTRKEAIQDLIEKYPIENQEALVALLKKEYGIDTNQSIVSRDLRDLGVSKHRLKDRMVYEVKAVDVAKEILRLSITDIVHNESMIVIKTLAGLAAFVGDFLDQQSDIQLLATLAGENVVFVAPQSTKNMKEVFEAVCVVVHFKKQQDEDAQ